MPLASKDGKLYAKTVTEIVDGKEVEVLKLCSSCCGTAPPDPIGCCYTYSYDNAGNPIFIVSKDTKKNCEDLQQQVDPSFDVVWNPLSDPDADCPADPPSPPGVCLYREDGLGTCTRYVLNGDLWGPYATKEEAEEQAVLAEQKPDGYPDCWKAKASEVYDDGGMWSFVVTYRELIEDDDGNYIGCETREDPTPVTEENCTDDDPVEGATWAPLPATHCRVVSSEDECTESTGVFCPNVTECPDDPSAGCPENPIRSNPLP